MGNNAIQIRDLGKQYRLGEHKDVFTLTEYISRKAKGLFGKMEEISQAEESTFWALRNVDYTLEKGKVLGVVGRNGSGKSTLLKLLSRIITPTEGEFSYNGSLSSLLEVGTGFKPELTGYDNIFLSGTILGMSHKEIQACLDEIIAFSEIDKFLNTPVKRYSSGMYVRLAFAVAAHLDPDILLIDEVLAVGDMKFQRKCLERMGKIAEEGRTVVFVSHNIQAVSQLCDQALLLDHGSLIASGDVPSVIEKYQDLNLSNTIDDAALSFDKKENSIAYIRQLIVGPASDPKLNFEILEPIELEITFEILTELENVMFELGIYTIDGMCVAYSRELDWVNFKEGRNLDQMPSKPGVYQCKGVIPAPLLNSGFYELRFFLSSPPYKSYDEINGVQIYITDNNGSYSSCVVKSSSPGLVTQPIEWTREQIN